MHHNSDTQKAEAARSAVTFKKANFEISDSCNVVDCLAFLKIEVKKKIMIKLYKLSKYQNNYFIRMSSEGAFLKYIWLMMVLLPS